MCVSRTRHVEPEKSAPGAVRNFAHALVLASLDPEGWGLADDVDLVCSELVSAAVANGATRIEFGVDIHYDRLTVSVAHDGASPAAPAEPAAVETLRENVLGAVTTKFVRTHRADGTTMLVARLPCDPELTGALECSLRP